MSGSVFDDFIQCIQLLEVINIVISEVVSRFLLNVCRSCMGGSGGGGGGGRRGEKMKKS